MSMFKGTSVESMTIGELADRTGLAVSAIRFYQRRGLLPARNVGSGWQRYGPDTLARLAVIELAKRAGFTLDEIIELLAAFEAEDSPAPTWQTLATSKLADIDTQITRLQHMRGLLTEALDCSCMTLDRAQLVPAALGWATERTTPDRPGPHQVDARLSATSGNG